MKNNNTTGLLKGFSGIFDSDWSIVAFSVKYFWKITVFQLKSIFHCYKALQEYWKCTVSQSLLQHVPLQNPFAKSQHKQIVIQLYIFGGVCNMVCTILLVNLELRQHKQHVQMNNAFLVNFSSDSFSAVKLK